MFVSEILQPQEARHRGWGQRTLESTMARSVRLMWAPIMCLSSQPTDFLNSSYIFFTLQNRRNLKRQLHRILF